MVKVNIMMLTGTSKKVHNYGLNRLRPKERSLAESARHLSAIYLGISSNTEQRNNKSGALLRTLWSKQIKKEFLLGIREWKNELKEWRRFN